MTPAMTPAATNLPGNSPSQTKVVVGTPFLAVSDSPSSIGLIAPTPTGTPPAGPRPAVKPGNLKIVKKTVNSISLVWSDSKNKAWNLAYRVHTGGVWINVKVNKLPTATNPFVLTGLQPGTNFDFHVAGVSSTGKRGPYGNQVSGRTAKGNPNGIWNLYARFNQNDKQLHVRWKNGVVPYTSIGIQVTCGGNTATFTVAAGSRNNFPIRRLPSGAKGCVVRVTPNYATGTGPAYQQTFDT
jgi:hypothetical protein